METRLIKPPPIASTPLRPRFTPCTWLACAACIVVFIGINVESGTGTWESFSKWGYYPPHRIRDGAFWGFFTPVFVHLEIWHVGFNVYWLYMLGSRLERAIGSVRWLVFFVVAAFASSGAEFAFTDSTGIGASGVVYAIFGFMWMTRKRYPSFEAMLTGQTIGLFFIWLLACLIMTLSK